jgi:hypothetical protein
MVRQKAVLMYEEQLTIHVCFKYLVSRTIFIAVQVNKKANNEEVFAPS